MKHKQSPAQVAAREKNWAKFSLLGAIGNLSRLRVEGDAAYRLERALKELKAAVKELP